MLGHYLMDHFTIEDAGGLMPGLHSSTREAVGRPCGFLIPKYVNTASSAARDRNPSFLRGYRFDGDGSQELYGHAFLMPELGDAWRKRVRGEIPYYFGIEAQGECLPRADNFVRLDSQEKMLGASPCCMSAQATERTNRRWPHPCAKTLAAFSTR